MAKINKAKVLNLLTFTKEEGNYVGSKAQVDAKLATQGENTDFISVRVSQEMFVRQPSGLITKQTRTARVTVPADLLDELVPPKKVIKKMIVDGVETEVESHVYQDINPLLEDWGLQAGRIIVEESFEPFYEGQGVKVNPSNHKTAPGEEILVDGQNIYYQTVVADWNSDRRDVRLVSSAVEELEPAIAGAE